MSLLMRPYYIVKLIVVFLYDLTISSLQVARAVVSPRDRIQPRVMTIPLTTRTDLQTTLVGNLISLTPGTLTVDVGEDGTTLLVHDMFAGDQPEDARRSVQEGLQKRVKDAAP